VEVSLGLALSKAFRSMRRGESSKALKLKQVLRLRGVCSPSK
jgi:hypothetical protein